MNHSNGFGKQSNKNTGKVVIEPVRVIEERKRIGLHPSCPVPAGAVLCYDSEFWQWVCGRPGYVECDGWLKGSFLAPCRNARTRGPPAAHDLGANRIGLDVQYPQQNERANE